MTIDLGGKWYLAELTHDGLVIDTWNSYDSKDMAIEARNKTILDYPEREKWFYIAYLSDRAGPEKEPTINFGHLAELLREIYDNEG